MKVTSCRNCPFRVSVFNDWSFANDTADICSLNSNQHLFHKNNTEENPTSPINIIRQYNEFEECDENGNLKEIPIPNWCPLKFSDKIEIELI